MYVMWCMRGSRKFCQRGSNWHFLYFFKSIRGERILLPQKAGHHQPASGTPFRWWADDGLTLNAGLIALWSGPVLLSLCFSRGWGSCPLLWIRTCDVYLMIQTIVISFIYLSTLIANIANNMDPDQTASQGAIWSGFIVFASMIKSSLKCIWI